MAIYNENKAAKNSDEEENAVLPSINEGDLLTLVKLKNEQKFTKPPARYTEASIIKTMEEKGIGRPSTLRYDNANSLQARIRCERR